MSNLIGLETRTEQERKAIASKGAQATNKIKRLNKCKRLSYEFLDLETKLEEYEQKLANKYATDTESVYNQQLTIKETNKLESLNNRSNKAYDVLQLAIREIKELYSIDYFKYAQQQAEEKRQFINSFMSKYKIKF